MRNPLPRVLRTLLAATLFTAASLAHAGFQFEEVYSNADGTVQYIVLHETAGANGLQGLRGLALTSAHASSIKTYFFTNDLPSSQTAGKRVLIATRGFAALNLVVPDYVIPDQFIAADNGTLSFTATPSQPLNFLDQFAIQSLVTDGDNAVFVLAPSNVVTVATNMATNFAGASARAPALPVTAVEYYNPSLDHYFMSALQPDIDALDTQRIPGWRRTGFSFKVFPSQASGGSAVSPVCRFYIPPEHGNSHFFSASPAECATVLQKTATDPNFSGYIYETANAFYIALPDMTGVCAAGTIPVYRLWNQRPDSNHRYTTDLVIKAQMIAAGSVAEGYGSDPVDMCAINPAVATVQVRVSSATPFAAGCDGQVPSGTLYSNAEVEPMLSINSRNPSNIVGVWQQDRWSNGGAPGNLTGASFDGGQTWSFGMAAFSRCSGGNPANGGDYPRTSDPWVSFAPDGTVHQAAISFSGDTQAPGSTSAVLASRSIDGGRTWSAPAVLISDTNAFFDDKDSITADPTDATLVYATWDRLMPDNTGPSYFARSTNGGVSWEAARAIFDPGVNRQTLNNQIVVLPDGTLVDFFTQLDFSGKFAVATLQIVRSVDKGVTWSAPITISPVFSLGTFDAATGVAVRDGSTLGSIAVGPHGELAAVWQDSRFSAGNFDGIALSRSLDGGFTWSAPVGINAVPGVAAFEPTVTFRSEGTMGVTYYDFRSGPATVSSLPTSYWLTHSGDGIVWRETPVTGTFDLATAPNAEGLFLGDYQALGSVGEAFLPFYVQTNSGNLANRTDVFVNRSTSVIESADETARLLPLRRSETLVRAQAALPLAMTPELAQRLRDSVVRVIERRKHRGGR
ncbi:MAG TPA: sialidase family protein [Casimicrobiaceae bacterium]|nr:sialidase family protein [Casimicrobiaceae bacterium]